MTKKTTKGIAIIKGTEKNVSREKYDFCYNMYLQNYKSGEIQQAFAEKFDDTERNARNYLSKVKTNIKEIKDANKTLYTNTVALQFQDLYNQLYLQKKFDKCAEVLKQMSTLLGLEAPKRIDVTNTNVNTIDVSKLSEEMINRLLDEGGITDAEVVE